MTQQSQHSVALIVMVLQQDHTPRGQRTASSCHDLPDGGKTIGAAIEGQAWLVITHHRLQPLDLGTGNVGGIGNHQLQLATPGGEALKPVRAQGLHPLGHTAVLDVCSGLGKGGRAHIRGHSSTGGHCLGQSHGKATGSSAEIGPEERSAGLIRPQELQGQIHKQFCFLAWDEHAGSHLQLQIPPGAAPHEVLERFRARAMAPPELLQLMAGSQQLDRLARMEPEGLQGGPGDSTTKIKQPVEIR